MKKREKIRYFLCGVLASALAVGIGTPALAALASKTIQVYTGVDVYVNDQKLDPKDANGNPVEVFVYNGTTYLPIRAIGNALGLSVSYDAATSSAYVGRHDSSTPSAWLADMDYFSGTKSVVTKASAQDNLGDTHYHCITNSFQRTYMLNGQYSRMTGTVYTPYEYRSDSHGCELNIYGDGKLLYTYTFDYGSGMKPADFNVNLNGVLELQVEFIGIIDRYGNRATNGNSTRVALGDVGLYT